MLWYLVFDLWIVFDVCLCAGDTEDFFDLIGLYKVVVERLKVTVESPWLYKCTEFAWINTSFQGKPDLMGQSRISLSMQLRNSLFLGRISILSLLSLIALNGCIAFGSLASNSSQPF